MALQIIFYLLLLDALIANFIAFFGRDWYIIHFRTLSRIFPPAKGWTVYYLILVLLIGYIVLY